MSEQAAKAHTPRAVNVRVALHADMRKYLKRGESGPRPVTLPAGATVADLLETMGIPDSEIVTVGINGELAQRHTRLPDKAEVTMFSPMEGG